MTEEVEREYHLMRGEYLSLMASLEYNVSFLIVELLEPRAHREEFHQWFFKAPIPLSWKTSLLERMLDGGQQISELDELANQIKEFQSLRNILAHSFSGGMGMRTTRGISVPAEQIAPDVILEKTEALRRLDNILLNILADVITGPIPPISADDFADWPI